MAARSRLLYAAGLGAYVLVRVGFAGFHPATFSDTAGYERTAHAPLWSARFLAGERAFVVPLVYKLVGNDTARIAFQLGFSIIAWSVLALVVARSLRSGWGRCVGFAAVLLFSATRYIIGWDPLLLSESLSLSLFALLVAATLMVARRPTPRWAGLLLLAAAAWAFVRDSNGVVVLLAGLVALALAVRPAHRKLKVAVGLAAVLVFVGNAVSADAGGRWQGPFGDLLAHRLPEQPALASYMRDQSRHPHRWLLDDARDAYVRYLALHPEYTLVEPFVGSQHTDFTSTGRADSLLDPHLDSYVATLNTAARLPRDAVDVLWIHSLAAVLAFAGVALLAAAAAARRRPTATAWLALGVLFSAYPAALAAWHLSGIEIDRHALGAAVELRLGGYLLLASAIDLVARRRRRATHA